MEQYEHEKDFRSAMLLGEQVSRLYPANANVRRRLANLYEKAGQIESVKVWQEAVNLAPANPEGNLGLARAAIRFGDRKTAHAALVRLAGQDKFREDLYRLRAGLAVAERDPQAQEQNLAALLALVPDDERVRFSLAVVQLQNPASSKAAGARITLLELARKDTLRMRAVVELLSDVARRWPTPTRERNEALKSLADALTTPRGPLLAAPSQVNHIARLMQYAMAQPAPEPEDVVSLANWMALNGEIQTALQWIDTLPARVKKHPLLQAAVAEFALQARDWERLRQSLLAGAWGNVPTEAIEQVFQVHATARRSANGVLPGWPAVLQSGGSSAAGLRLLWRLTQAWEWWAEYRQVLVAIARATPQENWAWRQLISEALVHGDTQELAQVYAEWKRAIPGDPIVQVESAIMGLLLGWKKNPTVAETAELVRQQPASAGVVVAHALALWRAERTSEAAAALDALPEQAFSEPRYALAYGLVLADASRVVDSEKMLRSFSPEVLLPEERVLLTAARVRNQRGSR